MMGTMDNLNVSCLIIILIACYLSKAIKISKLNYNINIKFQIIKILLRKL